MFGSPVRSTVLRPSLMGSELRPQNFELAKFQEIVPWKPWLWSVFFLEPGLRILKQFRVPAKFLAESELDNFLGSSPRGSCAAFWRYDTGTVREAESSRQQTVAFRYRRDSSPSELGYRGECPTCRPLPVLSFSLSIWGGSALGDVAASQTACRCLLHTWYTVQ